MKYTKIIITIALLAIMYARGNTSENESKQNDDTTNVEKTEISENVIKDTYECTKETAKDKYCYVKKVEEHNGKNYIVVDYIQFLYGEDAIKEAKKRGIDNGDITNDYIILNDNPKLRTFFVPNDIKVPIIAFDDNGNRLEKAVSITEINLRGMYSLTVKDGVVKSIKEEYLP